MPFDADFCDDLVEKCDNFFHLYLLPELVTHQWHTSNLLGYHPSKPQREQEDGDSSEIIDVGRLSPINPPETCVCGNLEYGKMITCANSGCEIGSYHYECVGINRKPRKIWFCPDCEDETTIDFMIN